MSQDDNIKLLPILAESYFIKQSFVPNTKCYEWYHKRKYYEACFIKLHLKPTMIGLNISLRRFIYDKEILYNYIYKKLEKK